MLHTSDPNEALAWLDKPGNVFLTGAGGCGKTYLVKRWLRGRDLAALTATTGVAAQLLGGVTIHRLLGLKVYARPELAPGIVNELFEQARFNYFAREKIELINRLEVLVIDECSMLRRDQFELVDEVLRGIRCNPDPFGGLKLVLTGDFYQLPPVVTGSDLARWHDLVRPYAFQSNLWQEAGFTEIELTKNWRQGDTDWTDILAECRVGQLSDEARFQLQHRLGADVDSEVKAIRLLPTNADVDGENKAALAELPGPVKAYGARFRGHYKWQEALKKEMVCQHLLTLKLGAQVMMLKNDPEDHYVNGSMGVVRSLPETDADRMKIELATGMTVAIDRAVWDKTDYALSGGKLTKDPKAAVQQWPVKLAYASTIHKSQGMTLDKVETDIAGVFAPGQAYVALSRCRSLEGLSLRTWDPKAVVAEPCVTRFYGHG